MKVLIADKFGSGGLHDLRAAGCDVIYDPELTDASLTEAIRTTSADVLVVRSTSVTEPMLDAGRLALIVRAGAGYDTIDVAGASRRGIYVSNCRGRNSVAVAELAFGLMLALDRRIPDNVADLRAGRWNKQEYSKARGLSGRTLGLLGYGSIGREMARRARAFSMPVVVWSRRFTAGVAPPHEPGLEIAATPAEVAARCDVLSVHLRLTPETQGLVNADVLGRLKPGSYFINTARGEIVDAQALEDAARTRDIRIALDVYAAEPAEATGDFTDPIVRLPNVYGTHHIGASTDQAQDAIGAETVRIIRTYKETGRVPNVVNLATRTPATHMLVVRHVDRPGVLAHVFDHLRVNDINVQETENIIFDGAQAAVARINLDRPPSANVLNIIRAGNSYILDLYLVAIGGHQPVTAASR